ncbi:hypothetical protein C8R47DRAFT_1213321 [Mycena vitilis]|nr:hypothetical protein C8R47DRAFT_1213321 [Mycena vitilis]
MHTSTLLVLLAPILIHAYPAVSHNPHSLALADYQATPSPAPAQDTSASSTSKPAAAQSEPAAKDKRAAPSSEQQKDQVDVQENSGDASQLISRRDDKVFGLRRRDVEEMTNINNRNFDHNAITRWSRAEVDKMHAWSKSNL